MTTPELVQYVKSEIEKGVDRNIIVGNLKTQGWTDGDIIEVYNIINQVPINQNETIIVPRAPKKTIKLIIPLVIVLFVLFGSVFYVSGYFIKSNNIFSKFTSSTKEIKNVSYDVDFALDLSDMKMDDEGDIFGDSSKKEINFKVSGISDMSNKDNMQFKSLISFEAGKFDGSVDLRMINKIIYFNIINAPEIGVVSLSPLENTWVKVPIEEKLNEMMGGSLGIESPINADVLSSLSDEQEEKIVEIVNKASLIKITKRHIPEMVDRSLSYHLEFELDKEGMIKFMKDIESFMVDLNKEELANISNGNDYDEIFDSLKTFKGEIWIGIFDNLPRKVQIDIVAINPSEPEDGSLNFKIAARYYDWNKPVVIETPAGSITIEEFIEKIMGSMMGGMNGSNLEISKEKSTDAKAKSLLANMRVYGEIYYDSSKIDSYKGFCSSKGGNNSDYGVSELVIELPAYSSFKCNDSKNAWAAWIKLSDDSYWCTDSSGYMASPKITPKGTSCTK